MIKITDEILDDLPNLKIAIDLIMEERIKEHYDEFIDELIKGDGSADSQLGLLLTPMQLKDDEETCY